MTESGDARFFDITNDAQYVGPLSVSGNGFSSTLTGYAPIGEKFTGGQTVTQFTVSGTIVQGVSIDVTYAVGVDPLAIDVTDDPGKYDQPSALSSLVGTWEGTGADGGTLTFTNQSDGSFFGQSTDGCTFTGNYTIINPSFNAYAVSLSETCPSGKTTESGLATLGTDSSASKPAIFFGVSDSQNSIAGEIIEQ